MRCQFGWFAVVGAAVVAPAIAAPVLQAGTPLATLRQAVTPARQPLPASLPVVTPGPAPAPPGDIPPFEIPLAEIPLAQRPAPLAPPVVRLPPGLVEAEETTDPTRAVELPQPAEVRVETPPAVPVLAGPFFEEPKSGGPILIGPTMANPEVTNPVLAGPFLAGPALSETTDTGLPMNGPPVFQPRGSQVVTAEATEPVVVAVEPRPNVAPVAVPATEPAKIEPLPANVTGGGAATEGENPTFDKPLNTIGVSIAPTEGLLPPNAAATFYGAREAVVPRAEHDTLFFWQATNLCHRPLYFEQDYLERDGRTFGAAQPLVSGAQFFGSVPLLPFRMVRQPPCRCIYTLGESRPDGYGGRHR